MNNISTDYVTVQIFPITPLSFIVQESCLLDVNVLVIECIRIRCKEKKIVYIYLDRELCLRRGCLG